MPSLKKLVNNLSNFQYYSGQGNFTANNLPYGKDRPGGGNSGQPYITTPPGYHWSPSNFDDGVVPFGASTALVRSFYDVQRIGKFFLDPPKGPLWLVKQTGLQRMNPVVQLGSLNTLDTSFLKQKTSGNRIYNPLGTNTLAQVASNAFGIHFTRHGLLPKIGNPQESDYLKANINPDSNNKFEKLRDNFARTVGNYTETTRTIASYSGGPQSYLGIGKTNILRIANKATDDSFAASQKDTPSNNGFVTIPLDTVFAIDQGVFTDTKYFENSNGEGDSTKAVFDFTKEDFRKYKVSSSRLTNIPYSDYTNPKTGNVEQRLGVIGTRNATKYNPNGRGSSNYAAEGPTDRVNMVSLYRADSAGDFTRTIDINGRMLDTTYIRDAIKFRIKSFDNDRTGENGIYMVFRAFLTSLSDNMNAAWTPYSYVGRGENFYLYDGFTADINLGFKVVALSRSEMKPIYQKLNYLKSCMTPDYTNSGKMRGNIMELTVGDYIRYQPGVITSLNYTIPQDTNWEIAIDYLGKDSDMHELPQMLDVTLAFTPIYRFLPRKSYEKPFIGIDDYRRGVKPQENQVGLVAASVDRDWTYVGKKRVSPGNVKTIGGGELYRI